MRPTRPAIAGLIGVLALSGCGGATSAGSTGAPTSAASASTHSVTVNATFGADTGVARTYKPELVPVGARGVVDSSGAEGGTTVMLAVRGLLPDRRYGAHAHAAACGTEGKDAGPHFQYDVDPVQPSVDPKYANPQNEIWLDLTTDANGAGTATATVGWEMPSDRRPHSVIIHAMGTATEAGRAGTAGDRAACITVDF